MKLPTQNNPARYLVRPGYTDEDTWRETLPNASLALFSMTDARMDAKDYMPAGGMKSSLVCGKPDPMQISAWRE